jgi:hypothetical protein
MARTTVVAGTATAVSNRVSRRQAGRWASQEAPAQQQQQYAEPAASAPPPAETSMDAKLAQLKELGELRERGLLSDSEFEVQKQHILAT